MIVPGSTSSPRAPTGRFPHPPLAGPHNSHVAGAGVGKRAHFMQLDPPIMHLSDSETDAVAAELAKIWRGMTGLAEVPPLDLLAVLVRRTLRMTRETIADRPDVDF